MLSDLNMLWVGLHSYDAASNVAGVSVVGWPSGESKAEREDDQQPSHDEIMAPDSS
jgi:hypothetical protein